MRLEVSLPDGFDSPGSASLDIGGAAVGDEGDACICILWRLAPAATHTARQCIQKHILSEQLCRSMTPSCTNLHTLYSCTHKENMHN